MDDIGFNLGCTVEDFDALVQCGLIVVEGGMFWSASLLERMAVYDEKRERLRKIGHLGGVAKAKANGKQKLSDKKRLDKKRKRVATADGLRLAQLLKVSILKWKPDCKLPDDLNSWALDIDRMLSLDSRSVAAIESVIRWLPTDSFWPKNIRSGKKLRDKFDTLEADMNKKPVRRFNPSNPEPPKSKPMTPIKMI
jgi:hypothetical protein